MVPRRRFSSRDPSIQIIYSAPQRRGSGASRPLRGLHAACLVSVEADEGKKLACLTYDIGPSSSAVIGERAAASWRCILVLLDAADGVRQTVSQPTVGCFRWCFRRHRAGDDKSKRL